MPLLWIRRAVWRMIRRYGSRDYPASIRFYLLMQDDIGPLSLLGGGVPVISWRFTWRMTFWGLTGVIRPARYVSTRMVAAVPVRWSMTMVGYSGSVRFSVVIMVRPLTSSRLPR